MQTADIKLLAEVEIEVPFHDADPMGVTWHGNYFRYFEIARCALLEKIDYNYRAMDASGFAWPIVETRVKYVRPTLYGQRIRVTAALQEYEYRLKIGYEIRDIDSGERVTRGFTIQVAVDQATREMCYVCPPALTDKLASWR